MNRKAIAAMCLAVSGTVASCGNSTNNTTSSSGGGGGPSSSSVKICILSEFRTRPDGLPGLESKYNAAFSKATFTDIGNTAEKTIANGQCTAGEVFTTDSAIKANNLYVLQDDKNLFPPDNAGLVVRASVLQQHPAIANLMAPVAAKLDIATMVALNGMVEIQNLKVADVAKTWLTQNGFLASSYGGGGGTNGSGSGCATASGSDGGGAHVSVGVKGFAEEQLLGAMTKLVLEAHNFVVDDTFQAKDKALGQALTAGSVDMIWQYTGTELTDYLGLATGAFPTALDDAFNFVAQKDAPNGLCWTSETKFTDTNGVAIKAAARATFGDTLSSFGAYLASH
jgi:glycine betaine/choline ABC-type transport system substrate-binding protein